MLSRVAERLYWMGR
ncbi:MAG: alpha-E domain-containing protein, partial [Gammaproteobacteria bacterium]